MPSGGPGHLLAIDQGTTSTRAVVFTASGRPVATAQREFPQHYPGPGWVEHDPEDIWRDTQAVVREALDRAGAPARVSVRALGIANQRETVVVWDRATGTPVHNAIVWQDRRTADACARLRADGAEALVRERTGLLLDPYFSATKLAWILDNVAGARARAERGELLAGTVDSFLLWRLTGGHATDATNAARTLLYDIHAGDWCDELLRLFRIPRALLPPVRDNAHPFGTTSLFGAPLPVCGMAGDQHAALVGQACLAPGSVKSTYGTGCFALLNTGPAAVPSRNRMLTTLAYRVAGRPTYAIEGAIFVAGAAVKWLRDGLGLITHASQTDGMAARAGGNHGVYLVPAFVGLGAPHWRPDARGLISGLTLDATAAHIARAALESVGYQTLDLLEAMRADLRAASPGGSGAAELRVDGGMSANDWLCQFLADLLGVPVLRPAVLETTALGAAFLAGLGAGVYGSLEEAGANWTEDRRFTPRMDPAERDRMVAGWHDALRRALA